MRQYPTSALTLVIRSYDIIGYQPTTGSTLDIIPSRVKPRGLLPLSHNQSSRCNLLSAAFESVAVRRLSKRVDLSAAALQSNSTLAMPPVNQLNSLRTPSELPPHNHMASAGRPVSLLAVARCHIC